MEVSSTSKKTKQKQNRFFREQNISNLLQTKPQSPTETLKWYKKRERNTFLFFLQYKKIGTVFFNQQHRVLLTGCCEKGPDSQTYEQNTLRKGKTDGEKEDRQSNADGETETLQSLLIQRAGDLMAKCEIQVTIHTGTSLCDALRWCLLNHSGCVGPLFCSHSEGYMRCRDLKHAQITAATQTRAQHCSPAGYHGYQVCFRLKRRGDGAPSPPTTPGCGLDKWGSETLIKTERGTRMAAKGLRRDE